MDYTAYRAIDVSEREQYQIDQKDGADHQGNREHMHRFNQGKQQIVFANIVRQSAVLEIGDELLKLMHHPAWV
jgi:hypothetical protein